MSISLFSEGPMVSYQGFIWPLLNCATRGHHYVLNLANPLEAGSTLLPPLCASQLLDLAGTPPPIHRTDLNTNSPQPFPAAGKAS